MICMVIGMNLLLAGCFYYAVNCKKTLRDTSVSPDERYELTLIEIGEPAWPFGSASGRLTLDNEAGSTASQVETGALDIQVMENRKNELVFTISTSDYVESYNSYYKVDYCRSLLPPVSQWQCFTYDSAIHSEYETKCYSFTEDEHVYSLPTIMVYVPTNDDYIQQITVNFDEHSFTQSGFERYKEMCYYTMKVFFPDLSDARIMDLCAEIVALGNQNVFSSDEWFSKNAVPFALFYREGIGVYPYFAIGDWEHFCIIPVTEETVTEFGEKGVQIHEIS